MPGRSVRIGRIVGIPVGISPWWLVVVALFTWVLGGSYYPSVVAGIQPGAAYALGLGSVLLLFASLLAHEFGHAIVARRHGVEVEEIDLWLLGGVTMMRNEAHEPEDELRYALAGPAVSALITLCFGLLALLVGPSSPAIVRALIDYELLVNGLILGFNLIPAFPLDGGRVLRSLLWRRSGDIGSATATAANVGRIFGYLLIGLGLAVFLSGYAEGLWLGVIGLFVVTAAGAQSAGAQAQSALGGVRASALMSSPVVSIPAELSGADASRDYFVRFRYTSFPVVDVSGRAVGLISLADLERTLPGEGALPVGSVADHDQDLLIPEGAEVTRLMERPAFARAGRAVVVNEMGVPVGLLSITDVQRALRAARLASEAPAARA